MPTNMKSFNVFCIGLNALLFPLLSGLFAYLHLRMHTALSIVQLCFGFVFIRLRHLDTMMTCLIISGMRTFVAWFPYTKLHSSNHGWSLWFAIQLILTITYRHMVYCLRNQRFNSLFFTRIFSKIKYFQSEFVLRCSGKYKQDYSNIIHILIYISIYILIYIKK